MGIVIDVVLVAIIVLSAIIGYKNGLIKVLLNIIAFLLSIIITFILIKPVSEFIIQNTDIKDNMKEKIVNMYVNDGVSDNEQNTPESNEIKKYIESKIKDAVDETKNEVIVVIADGLAVKIIQIITAIGLFVALRIILILLRLFSGFLEDLPIIKQANEIGGLIYGLLRADIIIFVLLTIFYFIVVSKPNGIIANAIEETYITKFLFDNNIIVSLFLNK